MGRSLFFGYYTGARNPPSAASQGAILKAEGQQDIRRTPHLYGVGLPIPLGITHSLQPVNIECVCARPHILRSRIDESLQPHKPYGRVSHVSDNLCTFARSRAEDEFGVRAHRNSRTGFVRNPHSTGLAAGCLAAPPGSARHCSGAHNGPLPSAPFMGLGRMPIVLPSTNELPIPPSPPRHANQCVEPRKESS